MNVRTKGLGAVHLSVLLLGGTALFSKLVPLPALDISFYRSIIACAFLALFVLLSGQRLGLARGRDYLTAILLGLLLGLHWVTYFLAMQLSTVAIGMIALFTYPVMTVLIEPLVNGEKPALADIFCGLLVFSGICLMVPELNIANETSLGILVGVLSALLFTARNVLYKKRFSQYSGAKTMFYQTLVTAIILVPWLGQGENIELDTMAMLVLLGIIFTAAPHTLLVTSLRYLSAKSVGLIACMQPLYGVIAAAVVLHEMPSTTTLIGGALILSGALYETVNSRKHS